MEREICSGCDKPWKIVNRKYKLCNSCNTRRLHPEKAEKHKINIINKVNNSVPKNKIAALVKKLDDIFSLYIRNRDASDGIIKCVTCPRRDLIKNMDCGHFISRAEFAVRWDEKNTAGQCKHCNGFRGGEQQLFAIAIDQRWGTGTVDMLQMKRRNRFKKDAFILEELIREYTQKLKHILDAKS